MRNLIFENADNHPIALLIKENAFNKQELIANYLTPLTEAGITQDNIIALSLAYNGAGKAPVKYIKAYLEDLMPSLGGVGVQYIYCADAAYFKALTKASKAEPHLGYVLPCKMIGYEHMQVILGVNHKSLLYSPANEPKLDMSMNTLITEFAGNYVPPGKDIIHKAFYPDDLATIKDMLNQLMACDRLTCDIETGSLDFDKAGVGTITFCWNKHEGLAFACDYVANPDGIDEDGQYGTLVHNPEVKALLKDFFENYTGTLIWHNSPYDTKILIYELWMEHLLDTKGLLTGLDILHKRLQDTKIITYLATNTTAGNSLALKDLGHEFAGAYGMGDNIKDIRRIPLPQLLEYNLTDGLCTWFVFDKYYLIMVEDQQEDLYYGLMLPSQKVITQIELSGMPLNPEQVQVARQKLEHIVQQEQAKFVNLPLIKRLEDKLTNMAFKKDFEDRKAKAKHPDKILPKNRATFPQFEFNPGSGPQLQILLYEEMGLPVVDKTKTKLPATGGKTLEKLANHTTDPVYLELMQALINHAHADKILTTFIPAFEKAIDKGDGLVYLHGSFNLGGTVSGRLSSSSPNLQNLPSGSTHSELVKECFTAPEGWLFVGADFSALEAKVNALLTKDPNKLAIYTQGFDSHSFNTYGYWPQMFPDLIPGDPESINTIKTTHKHQRGLSKAPTFAMQFSGTYRTLMKNCGFTEDEAKAIEASYHNLYKVSDEWVKDKLDQASQNGYVTSAFGLRIRTPLLGQTLRGRRSTPFEAEAEGRTAGNAIAGQSYGLLNNRACNAFMERVWNSRYRYDIKPVALIHDAVYILIKDDIDVVEWVNRELIKSMEWQELPELEHDTVKIGAALDVFYPNWASPCTLTNYADKKEIRATCAAFLEKLADKQKEAA